MQRACLTTAVVEDWTSIVHVPVGAVSADEVDEFAHTFDAYGIHGSLERIAAITDDVRAAWQAGRLDWCELDELRTALFMSTTVWSADGTRRSAVDSSADFRSDLLRVISELSGGLVADHRPIIL
jgi:hypothetical protein